MLIDLQHDHVLGCLPHIKEKIKAEKTNMECRLEELSDLVDSDTSARSKLGLLLRKLEHSLHSIATGRFDDLPQIIGSLERAMKEPKFCEVIQLMRKIEEGILRTRKGKT